MLAMLAMLLAPPPTVDEPIEPPAMRQLPADTVNPTIYDSPLPQGVTKRTIRGAWIAYERDHFAHAFTNNGYQEFFGFRCYDQCGIFLEIELECEVGREYPLTVEVRDRTYPLAMRCDRMKDGFATLIAPESPLSDTILESTGRIGFDISSLSATPRSSPRFSLTGAAATVRIVHEHDSRRHGTAAKPAVEPGR